MLGFIFGSLMTLGGVYAWNNYKSKLIKGDKFRSGNSLEIAALQDTMSGARSTYDVISGVHQSGFLTELIGQLWSYINVAVCQIVKESVEPTFQESLPGPLATLRFTKLDLGEVPIRLDNIVVHEVDRVDQTIQFELDIIWDGQCDIQLKADYIGTFGVRHMKLMGRMTIILKPLAPVMPIVQAVQYAFVNPPVVELDFTGLAQVADFSFIDQTIRTTIQDVLKGMIVLPNRMLFRMDNIIKFYDIHKPPVGVARITLLRGSGFQVEKQAFGRSDIPDVYCNMTVGNTTWKTSVVKDNCDPVWNETHDILLYDHDQVLFIHAFDQDTGAMDSDDDLGQAKITVGEILLATGRTKQVELLDTEHKGTGAYLQICADLCPLSSRDLKSIEEQKKLLKTKDKENKNYIMYGLVTIIVSRVTDIPLPAEQANCFVKVTYGEGGEGMEFETSPVLNDAINLVDGLNPIYDMPITIPLTAEITPQDITFELLCNSVGTVDKKDAKNWPKSLGKIKVYTATYMDAPDHTLTATRLIGEGAKLEYQIQLSGLQVPTADDPSLRASTTMTAAKDAENVSVKVTLKSGRGFQIEKRRLGRKGDIPDCYAKIKFGPLPGIWRTKTIKDQTEPVWNESQQYDFVHYGMMITVDVYDEDSGSRDKDDYIGMVRVSVGKLLLAGGNVELELLDKLGKGTGAYITLECAKIEAAAAAADGGGDKVDAEEAFALSLSKSASMTPPPIPLRPPIQVLPKNADQSKEEIISARVTLADGRGFKIQKKKMKKADIPDCYGLIKVVEDPTPNQIWKTSMIKDDTDPIWNECQDFYNVRYTMTLKVEIFDLDKNEDDDFLGSVEVPFYKLLDSPGDRVEVELKDEEGAGNGSFVTLIGTVITPDTVSVVTPETASVADMAPASPVTMDRGLDTSRSLEIKPSPEKSPSVIDVLSPSSVANIGNTELVNVSIKVSHGRGFVVQKKLLKKNDVPDCYCKVKFGPCDQIWRTSTIKDNLEPVWNESKSYRYVKYGMTIEIDVWDENSKGEDDYLGHASVKVSDLLEKLGAGVEAEIKMKSASTGAFIALVAESVEPVSHKTSITKIETPSTPAPTPAPAPLEITAKAAEPVPAPAEPVLVSEREPVQAPTPTPTPVSSKKPPSDQDKVSIRLTVVKGRDFPIEKKRFQKDDIPDCYCKIKMGSNKESWKTATIKDDCNPVWSNEVKDYKDVTYGETVHVAIWDKNSGVLDKDDYLGEFDVTVRQLLEKEGDEVEFALSAKGKPNGSYITLKGEKI